MKQLYNIARTAFYKKLLNNNKGWQISRIKYAMQGLAYCYGLDAVKAHEIIMVEPNVSFLDRTSFTVKYENRIDSSKDWIKNRISFAEMQMAINEMIYSEPVPKQVRCTK